MAGKSSSEPYEKSQYSNISTGELASDSDISDTEPFLQRLPPPSRRHTKIPILVVFAVLNITALALISIFLTHGPFPSIANSLLPQPSLFPPAELETLTFHDENIMPGPAADAVWADALPKGDGFTIIPDPDRYQLPAGLPYGEGTTRYGVTWAHQYHCVWMLRDFFFAAVSNSSIPSPLNGTGLDIDPSTAVGEKLWHLAHCLDYLRQTVVCTMDMTVEYPTLSAGGKPPAINGYEIEHVCRRRAPIDAFMAEHAPEGGMIPGSMAEGHVHDG